MEKRRLVHINGQSPAEHIKRMQQITVEFMARGTCKEPKIYLNHSHFREKKYVAIAIFTVIAA